MLEGETPIYFNWGFSICRKLNGAAKKPRLSRPPAHPKSLPLIENMGETEYGPDRKYTDKDHIFNRTGI